MAQKTLYLPINYLDEEALRNRRNGINTQYVSLIIDDSDNSLVGQVGAGTQTLAQTLVLGNNAGGTVITNLGTPVNPTDAVTKAYADALSGTALNSGQILVGNASNNSTAVTPSGDAAISNTGVITVIASSETQAGKIEIATQAEVSAGTDDTRAITPLKLRGEIASPADVQAGTANRILDASKVLDEDNFASDSNQHVPTQQSTKAYVDNLIVDEVVENAGALSGAAPTGAQVGIDTTTGQVYYVSAGNWTAVPTATIDLNTTVSDETGANGTGTTTPTTPPTPTPDIGDLHIEIYDDVTIYFTANATNWTAPTTVELSNSMINAASETVSGIAEIATQAETDAGTDDARIVTPLKLRQQVSTDADVSSATANKLVDTAKVLDEDDLASDSNQRLATQQSIKAYVDNHDVQVVTAAPVDGTTTAYEIGQLFWDRTNKNMYEATSASTAPLTAPAGSTFAQVLLGTTIYEYVLTPVANTSVVVRATRNDVTCNFAGGVYTFDCIDNTQPVILSVTVTSGDAGGTVGGYTNPNLTDAIVLEFTNYVGANSRTDIRPAALQVYDASNIFGNTDPSDTALYNIEDITGGLRAGISGGTGNILRQHINTLAASFPYHIIKATF